MTIRAAALAASVLLAACAPAMRADPGPVPSPSLDRHPTDRRAAQEGWLTAVAGYDAALAVAARYREDCREKPPALRERCMENVRRIRRAVLEAEEIREEGDDALSNGPTAFIRRATDRLERLRRRIEADVAASLGEERF